MNTQTQITEPEHTTPRYVKEKSKLPVEVSFEGGISKWSGLLDIALEGGFVTKPSNGWYAKKGEDKKYRYADTNNKDFWLSIITSKASNEYVDTRSKISASSIMNDVTSIDIEDEYDNA